MIPLKNKVKFKFLHYSGIKCFGKGSGGGMGFPSPFYY